MINLIRQYMETLKGGLHEPAVDAELEKIYREVARKNPEHRLAKIHELMRDGVSFNVTEQVRDLLAEEIAAANANHESEADK
jgi:hypothetical protein